MFRQLARSMLVAAMAGAGTGFFGLVAAADPLPRFATHVRTDIPCADTPFGRHVTIGGEFEAINLIATSGSFNNFDEYQPTLPADPNPLTRTFRTALYSGALAGTTFVRALSIDLNGDGRDEVVTAHRVTAGGALRLGVFRRTAAATLELFDTWNLAQTFTDVQLVAGDFDGSTDNKQEIGLLVRTSFTNLRAYTLIGGTDGGIVHADNFSNGLWTRTASFGQVSLTAGDMLLDGRDQLVIVAETGSGQSRAINYNLLEVNPTTAQLPIAAGDTVIGSKTFVSAMGTEYLTDDNSTFVNSINKLEADAGDVVDSAADELVTHMQFQASSFNYIGQRLHHFTTTRDAGNAITAIGFASRGPGRDFDSSKLVQNQSEDGLASFEATIANIDRVSPAEIVLARADVNPRLLVSAYKAKVEQRAGYTYVASGLSVDFTNTSTGAIVTHEWNFGDNSGPIFVINPIHPYTAAGTYTVTLKTTDNLGVIKTYAQQVTVSSSGSSSGGIAAAYWYLLNGTPSYESSYAVSSSNDLAFVNVAVADMNKDGIGEVMTVARDTSDRLLRSVWHLTNTAVPASFTGRHTTETLANFGSITVMDLLASDFDGDSVQATLGTDCRQVQEPQVRQVIWLPPFFNRLQGDANMMASFGESTEGGTSNEKRSGAFTSHDVSAYVGASVGSDLLGVDVSVKATAGYNYQSSYGAIHGSENSFRVDQPFSQDQGEALVIVEDNSFNCFSYDVERQSVGIDPNSAVRMCEVIDNSRYTSATDARAWDTLIPSAPTDNPPAQWMPLQRDWSSISLFKPATSNIGLVSGSGADKATDGLFSTAAMTTTINSTPYLQIDLGSVRDISNIRVFPMAGQAGKLKGFRVYTSATPISGNGVPTGAGISSFAPETEDDAAFDRWNIWTRNRNAPGDPMLGVRYIRLQHPGNAELRIAEVQVFGDTHLDPPTYPDAVCDSVKNDGVFNALVWDANSGASGAFRSIEVRGNMLWNGTGAMTGCTNYSGMLQADIWNGTVVGASGSVGWSLSQNASSLIGTNTSFESSVRVGAEFDLEAGFIATVQAGGAYEYTSGITEDVQSTSYWGSGLEIAGAVAGFGAPYASLISACRYNPRPYAYQLADVSNTGYEHTMYVVDYVVRQGPGLWQRGSVPAACSIDDVIFKSGFD